MRTSLLRKDQVLRSRYLAIINNFSISERPWDERSDKILSDFFMTTKTYKEIGSEIGLTNTRVGQIIAAQARRLLHPKGLAKYWDPNYKSDEKVYTPEDVAKTRIELAAKYGEVENWPIKELALPPASCNALLRCRIDTVEDLMRRFSELEDLRGVGPMRLKEIQDMVEVYELRNLLPFPKE